MRKQIKIWRFILSEWWRTRIMYNLAGLAHGLGMKLIRFSQKYRKSAILLTDVDYESRYAVTSNESRYAK